MSHSVNLQFVLVLPANQREKYILLRLTNALKAYLISNYEKIQNLTLMSQVEDYAYETFSYNRHFAWSGYLISALSRIKTNKYTRTNNRSARLGYL